MDQCAQGPLDVQVSWLSSHFSSECQGRKVFCLPKRQDGQNKCSLYWTQLPFRDSPLCSVCPLFFPVAIIPSSLSFPALLVTDVAFSVPAAPQSSDLYKICISTFSAEQIKSWASQAGRSVSGSPSCSSCLLALLLHGDECSRGAGVSLDSHGSQGRAPISWGRGKPDPQSDPVAVRVYPISEQLSMRNFFIRTLPGQIVPCLWALLISTGAGGAPAPVGVHLSIGLPVRNTGCKVNLCWGKAAVATFSVVTKFVITPEASGEIQQPWKLGLKSSSTLQMLMCFL